MARKWRATMPKLVAEQEKHDFVVAVRAPDGVRAELTGCITQEQSDRLITFMVSMIKEGKKNDKHN